MENARSYYLINLKYKAIVKKILMAIYINYNAYLIYTSNKGIHIIKLKENIEIKGVLIDMSIFKKNRCNHDYEFNNISKLGLISWPKWKYTCKKCGKIIWTYEDISC